MKNLDAKNVDEYIALFPESTQEILKEIRATIKRIVPEVEEHISYKMPAFKYNGILVYFAAYQHHIGFYALPTAHAAFQEDLRGYKTGKGSVQFPLNEPLPITLIEKIVKFRVAENLKKVNKI
tara:strand:+ start:2403 stop:2771 length:369 start_codon:yes stop_codon:yes gene_type:complete